MRATSLFEIPGEVSAIKISLSLILASMVLLSSRKQHPSAAAALGPPAGTTASGPACHLLIKNGKVIDGSGRPGYNADLVIKGDQIFASDSSH